MLHSADTDSVVKEPIRENKSLAEGTEENTEVTSRYSRPSGLDSNLVPPEYEARLNRYVQRD
jgi:hypothetical protein